LATVYEKKVIFIDWGQPFMPALCLWAAVSEYDQENDGCPHRNHKTGAKAYTKAYTGPGQKDRLIDPRDKT
jgi:hypothetical protein